MKKLRFNQLFFLTLVLLLVGCNQNQSDFNLFLESCFKKNIINSDSCVVDLKDFFKMDYDTMYVFGEYMQLNGIRKIIGIDSYHSHNILMPNGFLVADSYNKVILIKDHKVIYDEDCMSPYFYNIGVEVNKLGEFDGESFTYKAKIFLSSNFIVVRTKNGNMYEYVYYNIVED